MKNYKAYLIDLDGTMYRGVEVIPEAIIFIENLKRAGLPYLFVTNNSTKTPGQVAEHLTDMGIQAVSDDVFTTSQATVQFMMEQKREKTVYVIGERGIKQELTDNGFEITSSNPAFVVVGLDREVDYEKFSKADSCSSRWSDAYFDEWRCGNSDRARFASGKWFDHISRFRSHRNSTNIYWKA